MRKSTIVVAAAAAVKSSAALLYGTLLNGADSILEAVLQQLISSKAIYEANSTG